MQNTNTGTNSFNSNTANGISSGSDQGGLNRQLLGQQAEILSKIEVLLENQSRLELALRAAILAGVNV